MLKGPSIRWDFEVILERLIKSRRSIAVPKIGDVAELLRFRNRRLVYSSSRENFRTCLINWTWFDEIQIWDLTVTVILSQSDYEQVVG